MAITVTDAGTNTFTTVATQNITTTSACAAGGTILVCLTIASSSLWGVTDSAGNTYTAITPTVYNTTHRMMVFYCANNLFLASGGTITASWTTNASGQMAAAYATGLATSTPLDITGASNTGSGTSASIATGTLAQAAELVLGAIGILANPSTYTEASGFTAINSPTPAGTDNTKWAYQVVAATTTVTYAPSWVTSRSFGANVFSFKGAAVAAASPNFFNRAAQFEYLST